MTVSEGTFRFKKRENSFTDINLLGTLFCTMNVTHALHTR